MATLESLNMFNEGMSNDLSKVSQNNNSYTEAYNFRPITNTGSSSTSLVNIEGNLYQIDIPDTFPVYKLIINKQATTTSTVTVSILSSSTSIVVSNITTGFDLFRSLNTLSGYNTTFFLAYDDNYIVIWSDNQDPKVTISTNNILAFDAIQGNYYIPPQTNLEPIGSTYINDDIYVYTTNDSSLNPNSVGQIWKLNYNQITNTSSIKLIYNNFVNFSKQYAIAPTATLGRYENNNIQRLYFTDDYNKLRQANVANPNLMALTPNLLSVFPNNNFFIPTLKEVNMTGSVITGMYQFSYRLVKANGQISFWSPLSNYIGIYNNINESSFTNGVDFWRYVGLSTKQATNKAINITINKLDTNYDFIDLAVIKKYSVNDPGTVEIFKTNVPIPNTGTITTDYTQTEKVLNLTLEELLQNNNGFTHCKTIATKDNILFAGKVRNVLEDISYDARAYQYPLNNLNTTITDGINTSTYSFSNLNIPFFLQENNDSINANFSTNRFKPGTNIPGGVGSNISYEFGTHCLKIDELADFNFNLTRADSPWRNCNQLYDYQLGIDTNGINFGIDGANYPFNNTNDTLRSVYKSTLLKGYRHNEIYRFGIQFYDKEGKPFFVKWIGDIKFPDYSDFNPNPGYIDNNIPSGINDYTPIFTKDPGNGLRAYMNILYIKFNVNIPNNIKSLISGFEIVRAVRTENDKTIVATGLLNQVRSDGAANLYIPNTGNNNARTSNGISITSSDNAALNISIENRGVQGGSSPFDFTFENFDWNINSTTPNFNTSTDSIQIKGRISPSITALGFTTSASLTADPGDGYYYAKFYNWLNSYQDSIADNYKISDLKFLYKGDSYTSPNNAGWGLTNSDKPSSGNIRMFGIDTFYLVVDNSKPLLYTGNYNCDSFNQAKLFFEYRRNVVNQYGGRSYNLRSQTEYISTGALVSVDDKSLNLNNNINFQVFGGDCFYGIHQNQKGVKNITNQADSRESYVHYKPHIGTHNVELRAGKFFDYYNGATVSATNLNEEDFTYETTYSIENNTRKFISKPVIFNDTDSWNNRIYYSNIKINGEVADSWSKFKLGNYWDVEGNYGPITSLISLQDKLYYLQNDGFGILHVNPIAAITTTSGLPVTLGKGNVIQKHDYITTNLGTKHQFSVYSSSNSLVFIDSVRKKIMRFNGELQSLSDNLGLRGFTLRYLNNNPNISDKPVLNNAIISYYDNLNNEFIFTFNNNDNKITIAFNEVISKFTSYYSFTPKLYIGNNKEFYSSDPNNSKKLYIHNRGRYSNFYNNNFDSIVKFIVNEQPTLTKVFNNLQWYSETILNNNIYNQEDDINIYNNTFYKLRIYNDYQNTDFTNLVLNNNLKRIERNWNVQVPRNKVLYSNNQSPNIFTDLGVKDYGERIRDKYALVELYYSNNNNYKFTVHSVKSAFLVSDR